MKGYDIKIRLDDFRPLTWRDVIIPENITFKQLHACIQIIYGLDDTGGLFHLYQFSFKDSPTLIKDLSQDWVSLSPEVEIDVDTTFIDEYFKNNKFIYYEYDFGDGWLFKIEIKKIIDYDKKYPTIKRFKGDYNLISDCGGVGGMEQLIYLKNHPDEAEEYQLENLDYLTKFDLEDAQIDLEIYFK